MKNTTTFSIHGILNCFNTSSLIYTLQQKHKVQMYIKFIKLDSFWLMSIDIQFRIHRKWHRLPSTHYKHACIVLLPFFPLQQPSLLHYNQFNTINLFIDGNADTKACIMNNIPWFEGLSFHFWMKKWSNFPKFQLYSGWMGTLE